jgi:hypothetical protein
MVKRWDELQVDAVPKVEELALRELETKRSRGKR